MEKKISKDLAEKIQELQIIEQSLQNVLMQKQAIQFELNESLEALEELGNSKGDVYKVVGQIMIKSKKEDLKKDLDGKREVAELKLKNFDRQESSLKEKLTKLRSEVMSRLK